MGGRGMLPTSTVDIDHNSSSSAAPRGLSGGSRGGIGSSGRASRLGSESGARSSRQLSRQEEGLSGDSAWVTCEVATAISRDLVGKAERWKLLAKEPLTGNGSPPCHDHSQLPEIDPVLACDVDKHQVASIYAKDALAGRQSPACIHDQSSLRALKLIRNKSWNQLLNVCTIIHLILPMVEIQRCLPCMGMQRLPEALNSNSLHQGWRPTLLGSMWVECLLWLLYAYDLYQVTLSSSTYVHDRIDASIRGGRSGGNKEPVRSASLAKLPPWQLARTCMVALLGFGLLTNIFAHYMFGITWHRWSRVTLPFLFISRRTYLKHFVGGMIRVLPRMLPVGFLMSFVVFFYGFLGYIVYRDEPRDSSILGDLDLFSEPTSSALTFLRMFTSIPFMLDVEQIYRGKKGIQVMGLSYGVIMVIFLGALVPAVANRNFQHQSKESYNWVKEQRKLALTRAYMLLKRGNGTVGRDDWVRLMACLRPDCDAAHTSALFDAARKAEDQITSLPEEDDRNRLSKEGFFMLCALGTANFSRAQKERTGKVPNGRRSAGKWKQVRQRLDGILSWSMPGSNFPLSRQVLNVALVVQGYQVVLEGDDPERRPGWAYPLGACLIAYFCVHASLRMLAEGARSYMKQWRHALGMCLNLIGVAYYTGFWFDGEGWRSLYHILQASRVVVLWNVLHRLGSTSSEVATRLEFVFPAVLRASFVLFSVTYSYAVLAYAMYCSTPLGTKPLEGVADHSMMKRWAVYKEVISFASLYQSFASLTDVIMLSNWPMFMDAAGDAGGVVTARIFFYSFKVLTFYFVMPVMLGFIVQSYMAAQLPGCDATHKPGTSATPLTGGSSDAISFSRKSQKDGGGAFRGGRGAGEADPLLPVRSQRDKGRGTGIGEGTGVSDLLSSSRRSYSDGSDGPAAAGEARAGAGGGVGVEFGSVGGKALGKNGAGSKDGASDTPYGGKFGYSTLADGAQNEVDVLALVDEGTKNGVPGGGMVDLGGNMEAALNNDGSLSSSEEDNSAPVVITSHARSMSQTFWGAEQANDHEQGGTTLASTEMQDNLTRLETENASLRALVDSMQMDLQMANARLYEELQTPSRDRSPSPARAPSRRGVGGMDGSGLGGKPLSFMSPENVAPLRKRVGSANSSIGGELEAIVETEDEEVGIL
eukprot:g12951.t1